MPVECPSLQWKRIAYRPTGSIENGRTSLLIDLSRGRLTRVSAERLGGRRCGQFARTAARGLGRALCTGWLEPWPFTVSAGSPVRVADPTPVRGYLNGVVRPSDQLTVRASDEALVLR
jgi:hypothetical protein